MRMRAASANERRPHAICTAACSHESQKAFENAKTMIDLLNTRWRTEAELPAATQPVANLNQAQRIYTCFAELLTAINTKMLLTITLTTSFQTAINTFANLNYTGLPLAAPDVLRAYLLTAFHTANPGGGQILGRHTDVQNCLDR